MHVGKSTVSSCTHPEEIEDVLKFFREEKFQEPFFHLACGRHVSLTHVVAMDPLVDSIPDLALMVGPVRFFI